MGSWTIVEQGQLAGLRVGLRQRLIVHIVVEFDSGQGADERYAREIVELEVLGAGDIAGEEPLVMVRLIIFQLCALRTAGAETVAPPQRQFQDGVVFGVGSDHVVCGRDPCVGQGQGDR